MPTSPTPPSLFSSLTHASLPPPSLPALSCRSSLLQVMVRDPYGNYVVQKILDIADDRQQEALCSYLKHHAAQLKRYTYGKHILVRLEKISGEKML